MCVVSWVSGNTTAISGEADIANSYGEGTSLGVQYEDSKFLVRSLGQEDPLEKEMATHSSTLAWKIPWTEEPGRLQSMGLQRVEHD